jgi:hypothetical protein
MTIYEPVTLLTDVVLAALAATLAWRLPVANPAARCWRRALACTALSALVGGSYHGFAPNFPAGIAEPWWLLTLLIICGFSALMTLSLVHELVPPAQQPFWLGLIGLKFVVSASYAAIHPVFLVAIADYGLMMLAWTAAALLTRRAWRGWMLTAIGLSALAALVQQKRWGLSAQFNHNDLYHVVQAFGLVAFYRAGRAFTTPGPAAPAAPARATPLS